MGETLKKKKENKIFYFFIRLIIIILIFTGVGIYIYSEDYYRASVTAENALASDDAVTFSMVKGDLVFTPENPKGGVVIYPGGKVSERAYAYLANKISKMGYKTIILKVPLKLSILYSSKAKNYVSDNEIDDWVIIGHSLGGVSASIFTEKYPEKIKALVLLASYPSSNTDLSNVPFKVYSLVGEKDSIIDRSALLKADLRLPETTVHIDILGGNHSSFANYGVQDGDSLPDIGFEEQQQFILNLLGEAFE
ncbi:MAG: alpha/beta fold hydrolase [Clostridiaceae bacterium]